MAASRVCSWRHFRAHRKFCRVGLCVILALQILLGIAFYSFTEEQRSVSSFGSVIDGVPKLKVVNKASNSKTNSLLKNHGEQSSGSKPPSPKTSDPPQLRMWCNVTEKEALSALNRASTVACKQQIVDAHCLQQKGQLFPQSLGRQCPLSTADEGHHYGCYKDDASKRDLDAYRAVFTADNSPRKCLNHCLKGGFAFAGVQYSTECHCGQTYGRYERLPDSACDHPCPADASNDGAANDDEKLKCGGYLAQNIYGTGLGRKADNKAELVDPDKFKLGQYKDARIAFVLTLNGRAVRQVRRLFRLIYNSRHFYLIHVDSRQDYLHRQAAILAEEFPLNVRLVSQRGTPIWGGTSLLTMHLSAMRDLLSMPDWDWDFFLNLSESDLPVKSNDALVAFLTTNLHKNFVKSHGKDTPKFIKKQGLDRNFVECDTHMWQVGKRELPSGIRFDGGSDWVALSKQFCKYVAFAEDPLVAGLKRLYNHVLLPSESFFHTVLQNSFFCDTFIDNNLHLTNWRRKQGCKCQYKHIVDWCGCSPNDFLSEDFSRINNTLEKPIFFARKFEAIINQKVINIVEQWLYGPFPANGSWPALHSYWENAFHHEDKSPPVNSAYFTHYLSFARLATKMLKSSSRGVLSFEPAGDPLEATYYLRHDAYQGLLILFRARSTVGPRATAKTLLIEARVDQKPVYKVSNPHKQPADSPIGRLKNFAVSTNFDQKEEVFRNLARLIGPYSDVMMIHEWEGGEAFGVSIVWIDPSNSVAASFDTKVQEGVKLFYHKPNFTLPLRPGVWKVKMMYQWEEVAETQFVVSPLSHVSREEAMSPAVARVAHGGPLPKPGASHGLYTSKNFTEFDKFFELKGQDDLLEQLRINSSLVGPKLVNWIDDLISQFFFINSFCIVDELSYEHDSNWRVRSRERHLARQGARLGGQGGRSEDKAKTPSKAQLENSEFLNTVLKLSPDSSKCVETYWSSLSPDPKSEFGQIDMSTGKMLRNGEKPKPPPVQRRGKGAFG